MSVKSLANLIVPLVAVASLVAAAVVAIADPVNVDGATQQESDDARAEGDVALGRRLPATTVAKLKEPVGATLRPSVTGGRFTLEAWNDPPVEKWLHQMLDKPVPLCNFPGDTPLSVILDRLENHFNETYGNYGEPYLRMVIWPDYPELEIDGIVSLEDVTVRDIVGDGIPLKSMLDLVFERTTNPALSYTVFRNALFVSTRAKIEFGNFYTRGYWLGSLVNLDVSAPLASDIRASGKSADITASPDIASVLVEMTSSPARWMHLDGEGGSIRLVGNTLIVRQTRSAHRQIVGLLNMLDLAEGE